MTTLQAPSQSESSSHQHSSSSPSPYFLPKTSHNVRAYASSLEDTYFPSLGASHAELNKSVADATVDLRRSFREAVKKSENAVEEGLKKAEEWSGLKLNAGSGKK